MTDSNVPEITEEDFVEIKDLYRTYPDARPEDIKDKTSKGFYLVSVEHSGSTRWSQLYDKTFTDGKGNFWQYVDERGSTEMQEVDDYLTVADIYRVTPVQVTTTVYKKV